MFGDAIKSIIDLLKLRKDVKKTDLEIEKLKREEKSAKSMLTPATFEDIKRFDPKVKKILSKKHGKRKIIYESLISESMKQRLMILKNYILPRIIRNKITFLTSLFIIFVIIRNI